MIKVKKLLYWVIIPIILMALILFSFVPKPGAIMVLSLSSDGNYAVTSHLGNIVILWDITKKQKKIISRHANIYSAYFIKNTHNFMWQDLKDIVHVQNVSGKEIKKFSNFATYGHVLTSDLQHYFSVDKDWNLYSGYEETQQKIMDDSHSGGFIGAGKLLNLSLSSDNQLLLSSGIGWRDYDNLPSSKLHYTVEKQQQNGIQMIRNIPFLEGITLWQVSTGISLQRYPGPLAKAIGILSPDDKYVVGGDEGSGAFLWNTQTGKRVFELDDLYWGRPNNPNDMPSTWDRSHLIKWPDDFVEKNGSSPTINAIMALKFIDLNGHYLRFTTYVPYAVLHSVTDPAPLKYFRLGKDPFPSVSDYSRNQSIDTAPAANILVTGQDDGNGIIVYHFDPQKLTLEKVWVAKG